MLWVLTACPRLPWYFSLSVTVRISRCLKPFQAGLDSHPVILGLGNGDDGGSPWACLLCSKAAASTLSSCIWECYLGAQLSCQIFHQLQVLQIWIGGEEIWGQGESSRELGTKNSLLRHWKTCSKANSPISIYSSRDLQMSAPPLLSPGTVSVISGAVGAHWALTGAFLPHLFLPHNMAEGIRGSQQLLGLSPAFTEEQNIAFNALLHK